jgi:hypothetical protein
LAVIRIGIEVADVNTVLVADWLGRRHNQLSSRSVNKDIEGNKRDRQLGAAMRPHRK